MIDKATVERFSNIRPARRGLEKLALEIEAYDHSNADPECRLIWLIDAWSGGAGSQELAELIEGSLGPLYLELEKALAEIGAHRSVEYLLRGRAICGGAIPEDERERARLTERNEAALFALFKEYKLRISEEAPECMFSYLIRKPG